MNRILTNPLHPAPRGVEPSKTVDQRKLRNEIPWLLTGRRCKGYGRVHHRYQDRPKLPGFGSGRHAERSARLPLAYCPDQELTEKDELLKTSTADLLEMQKKYTILDCEKRELQSQATRYKALATPPAPHPLSSAHAHSRIRELSRF